MLKKINQNSFDGNSSGNGTNHNGKSIYVPASSAHELSITNTKSTKTVIEMRYPTSGGTPGGTPIIGTPGHPMGAHGGGNHTAATNTTGSTVEIVTVIPTNTDFANDFDQEECYEWVSCKLVSSGFEYQNIRIFTTPGLHTCLPHLVANLFGY